MNDSEEKTTAQVFLLDQDLTIADATELQQRMLQLLQSGSAEILLDGSAVAQVDGAGVQLLAALANEVRLRRVKLVWTGVSESLDNAARQLGLGELLNLAAAKT
jgi:anti-anti-sigma factor